jgi:hypothetical protein
MPFRRLGLSFASSIYCNPENSMLRLLLGSAGIVLAVAGPVAAEIKLVGKTTIPGDAVDRSGLTDILKDGTPHNRLGGYGSAIAYTGRGNRYVTVADRGPSDGTIPFLCRMHTFDITLKGGKLHAALVETVMLKDSSGENFNGAATELGRTKAGTPLRLDPEGIRVGPGGSIFISDEYGPYVYEFDRKGTRLRSLPVPEPFQIARPSADPKAELKDNRSGRVPNRGLEGLAISPDGSKLYGCMQSPLIQDGGRQGTCIRVLEIDVKTGRTREFLYPLASAKVAVSEIVAINDHQFLVLERDGKPKKFRKVFKIDIRGASDVSTIDALPAKGIPAGVTPVRKELFLDFLDPRFGLDTPEQPDKIEGLAFGPDLPDGRHLLLVTTDNDFIATEATHIFAFAIDAGDLPGFQRQQFEP